MIRRGGSMDEGKRMERGSKAIDVRRGSEGERH